MKGPLDPATSAFTATRSTGTPCGVGCYREPKRLLHDGDKIVAQMDRIGRLGD
jgi:hypothetical protein